MPGPIREPGEPSESHRSVIYLPLRDSHRASATSFIFNFIFQLAREIS